MDMIIQLAAAGFLLLTVIYSGSLVLANFRNATFNRQSHELRRQKMRSEIDRVLDLKRFDREQNELSWNGFRKFVVAKKHYEGGDICSFYLEPHDKKPLPPFHPGQYLTFNLDIPGQKKQTIRCYSLSDSPNPTYYRVSIKRVPPPRGSDHPPGLSSNHFHDNINEGDILDVKAPSGVFHIDMSKNSPVVLIGGGVGLTPVMSMLNALSDVDSKRETWFFYGARTKAELVMVEHLLEKNQQMENVNMYLCLSDPTDDCPPVGGVWRHGRVGIDAFKELLPSNNYDYYFCGPPPMMSALNDGLLEWGVPEKNIHYETFGPASVKKVKKPAEDKPTAEAAAGIAVHFTKSGKTVTWTEDDGSLLDLAEDNDVDMDFGCRAGNCGTCLTALNGGEIDYITEPGFEAEDGSCLPCVCRPKTELKIDA